MKKKIKLPASNIRAMFQPESYDAKRNTIDLVWTTGARVKRMSFFDGPFYEELAVDKKSIRLDRLNAGAPVLNSHGTGGLFSSGGLRDILGVVEKASIREGEGHATIRFSGRDDVKDLIEDVKSGVIRNVSVGYVVHKFEELDEEAEDGSPILRAVDWEPMEISFVGIPADAQSQVRNADTMINHEAEIDTREDSKMPFGKKKQRASAENESGNEGAQNGGEQNENENASEGASDQNDQNQSDPGAAIGGKPSGSGYANSGDDEGEGDKGKKKPAAPSPVPGSVLTEDPKMGRSPEEIQRLEISRQDNIRRAVRAAGISEDFADNLVRTLVPVDQARAMIFQELERRTGTATRTIHLESGADMQVARRQAGSRALLHRFNPEKYKLNQGDNEFCQGSLLDMCRHYLGMSGVRGAYTMSRADIARRALHTTSDFPELLADTGNRSMRDAYAEVPATWQPFTKENNGVQDFGEITSMQMSNGGRLEAVGEHGEYKRTTFEESAEKYRLGKFGIIVGKTFELILADKIGAFTDMPARLGRKAREKENEIFWSLILGNPLMADGYAFFSPEHNNVTASGGGAPDVAKLGVARGKFRVQTDLDGDILNLTPDWLVVPAALETTADALTSPIVANGVAAVNPFQSRLKVLSEARLDANSTAKWYMFTDKAKLAIAEIARLDGRGPEFFTREGFEIDGTEVKVRYVFGMKLMDYRGAYRNVGA